MKHEIIILFLTINEIGIVM